MQRALFIYWRVAGSALDSHQAAAAAARQMQAALCEAEPGLVARLYRKADGDGCTLMETYALPGGDIGPALQQRIEATAARILATWCAGERHVEAFEDCS